MLAAHLSRVTCYSSTGLCFAAGSCCCWPLPGGSRQLLSVKDGLSFPLVFCDIRNLLAWNPSQGEQAELRSSGKAAQRKSLFPWRAVSSCYCVYNMPNMLLSSATRSLLCWMLSPAPKLLGCRNPTARGWKQEELLP